MRETVRGVEIHRSWGPSLDRHSLVGRGMNVAVYAALAAARALLSKKADVVLFMTDPPFFPLLGAALGILRGEKIVYILMDLYPEVAFRAGSLREGSAAGRPILYQGSPQGEIARMVAREGIGAVVLPGDRAPPVPGDDPCRRGDPRRFHRVVIRRDHP